MQNEKQFFIFFPYVYSFYVKLIGNADWNVSIGNILTETKP